jgi:predicted alpha/beta-hydrolase family hydrolase
MTSLFLDRIAVEITGHGIAVSRFEFDYMARRRDDGVKRPPPRVTTLVEEFDAAARALAAEVGRPVMIGGKSMGGRVATMIADRLHRDGVAVGCVVLGYPFQPPRKPGEPGKPDKPGKPSQPVPTEAAARTSATSRIEHLATLACPALIIQGTRDAFGRQPLVAGLVAGSALSPAITIHWLPDGDHDFAPRRTSGHTFESHIADAAARIAAFADRLGEKL